MELGKYFIAWTTVLFRHCVGLHLDERIFLASMILNGRDERYMKVRDKKLAIWWRVGIKEEFELKGQLNGEGDKKV